MFPLTIVNKVDQAFVLVNDERDEDFNNKIRFYEINLHLIKDANTKGAIHSIFLESLDNFSTQLWEKIQK
jgi:hypothetical protein